MMELIAIVRLFEAPVPPGVLEAVAGRGIDEELAAGVATGALLQDGDGLVRANPLVGGRRSEAVDRAWPAVRDWLGTVPWPSDANLVDGLRLALAAGDEGGARELLERLVLGAVLAYSAREPARALVEAGLVGTLLPLDRQAVLLLLVDGERGREVAPLLGPDDAWLRARLALAEGRPEAAVPPEAGSPWADLVAADVLVLQGRADDAVRRLLPHADVEEPLLLRAELLRATARACSEATLFEQASEARSALEELAELRGEPRLQLSVLLGRAGEDYRLGRFDKARRWLAEFDAVAAQLPASRLRASADFLAAALAVYGGDDRGTARPLSARSQSPPALEPFWATLEALLGFLQGDVSRAKALALTVQETFAGYAPLLLAEIAIFQGRLDEAAGWFDHLPSDWPVIGNTGQIHLARLRWLQGEPVPEPGRPFVNLMVESMALLLDAERALERVDLPAARRALQDALALIDRHEQGWLQSTAWFLLADVAARTGDRDEALRFLERATDRLAHPHGPDSGRVAAARCVLAGRPPTPEEWARWVEAQDWCALGLAARDHAPPASAAALVAALPERLRSLAGQAFPPEAAPDVLHVGPGATWFQPPGAERQDIGRRRSLRALLDALVRQRQTAPDSPLSVDELLAAGWPGEKVLPFAGRNRVHVALTTLRGLGLRGVLQSHEGGYVLDAGVPIVQHES